MVDGAKVVAFLPQAKGGPSRTAAAPCGWGPLDERHILPYDLAGFQSVYSFFMKLAVMSTGEGSATEYKTARGRNYPTIRQFTVFLENRVGQLLEMVRRFEGTGIRIVALSINDSAECAFVRFVVSNPERGREILERAGLAMIESDLIGLELPEGSQPLLQVCVALLQAEINIIQAYPLIARPSWRSGRSHHGRRHRRCPRHARPPRLPHDHRRRPERRTDRIGVGVGSIHFLSFNFLSDSYLTKKLGDKK